MNGVHEEYDKAAAAVIWCAFGFVVLAALAWVLA